MTPYLLCIASCSVPRAISAEWSGACHRLCNGACTMNRFRHSGLFVLSLGYDGVIGGRYFAHMARAAVQHLQEAVGGPFAAPGAEAPLSFRDARRHAPCRRCPPTTSLVAARVVPH